MFGLASRSTAQVRPISGTDAVARHARGDLTMLDVRELAEVRASGTAAGGVHIPLMLLTSRADPRHPEHDARLTPSQPVAVFCAAGGRSRMAAQRLAQLRYQDIFDLGSFSTWQQAGGAVA